MNTPPSNSMTSREWNEKRQNRLRELDDVLKLLEDGHEMDMVFVNAALVRLIQPKVSTIVVGMKISDAIEEVLHHQESYMIRASLVGGGKHRSVHRKRPTLNLAEILKGDDPPSSRRASGN